jgi:adenosylmethionine-8-amino-7-oxononanoate aminotransferase
MVRSVRIAQFVSRRTFANPRHKSTYTAVSSTGGASGFPKVNARYMGDPHLDLPELPPIADAPGASDKHWDEEWSSSDLASAVDANVMLSWGPSKPRNNLRQIVRGEGVYLYDQDGNQYLDWTSQAVCSNFGHDVPEAVVGAINTQLRTVPYLYGGLGMVPVRARLSKLLADITPGDLTGFLFPTGGTEANEAAIRMARRYTGRHKIMSQYRSYHGGSANSLGATGDFRRGFTEMGVTGFVKIFNPQPQGFSWGRTDEEAGRLALQALEEQILVEGPTTIAAIMLETVVGAGGVLVPPEGYMQGVRALCDKYNIVLILDEVMCGFGRTGELFAFQNFEGVVPDIVTSAKGLTGAFLPMSLVGVREHIRQHFVDHPLGWGATYHAHPVAMACAYECVKHIVESKMAENAKAMQPVMMEEISKLVEKHESVKQGRCIGLFGCIDLQGKDGRSIQQLAAPSPAYVTKFRKTMFDHGLIALFRPPLLHCTPPLVITEAELRDGFQRLSGALETLDADLE